MAGDSAQTGAATIPKSSTPATGWLGDLAAVLVVGAVAFVPVPGEQPLDTPLAIVLAILPAVAMPFRRRWPRMVLATCVLLLASVASIGTVSLGAVLALGIAMFAVAVRSPRLTALVCAAIAVITTAAITLIAGIGGDFDPLTFQVSLTIAFAAAAGDATRSRRLYISAIMERAGRAESERDAEAHRRVIEERLNIARDLHDTVAHQIAVISLNSGVAAAALDSRPERAQEALATIRAASRAVLSDIGNLLELLRTTTDETGRVQRRPQPGLDELEELVARFVNLGLNVRLRVQGDPFRLAPAADQVAYRVIQEALTNARTLRRPGDSSAAMG